MISLFFVALLSIGTAGAPDAAAPAPRLPGGVDYFHFDEAEPWRRAQTLDRPILLVLGVRWSRESNLFYTEVLTRADVSDILRRQYVVIVADADQRPDLRDRYPAPAWPALTVLTPKGDPVYFKPENKDAPRPVRMTATGVSPDKLAAFLREAADWYRAARAQGGGKFFSSALTSELQERESLKPAQASATDVDAAREQVRGSVDVLAGGFSKSPKYLQASAVEASLLGFRLTGDRELLAAAEKQMIGLRKLTDPQDGGVHRLAAREDWSGIQYERLLAGNAEALSAWSDLYRATGNADYLADARKVASFILGPLSNPDGSFAHAQAADISSPDGGGWFRLPAAGRAASPEAPILREPYAGSTSRAALALLQFASAADAPEARDRALRALAWLEGSAWKSGRGVAHAPSTPSATVAGVPVLLDDQVEFIAAEIEAWQQTGRQEYLDRAKDTARFVRDNLRDEKSGALMDRIPMPGGPRLLQTALYPFDANCEAVRQFARLHYATRAPDGTVPWGNVAGRVLDAMAGRAGISGARSASRMLASYEYFEGPAWIIFVGAPDSDIPSRRLFDAAWRLPFSFRMRQVLDPARPADLERIRAINLVRKDPPVVYLSSLGLTSPGAGQVDELPGLYALLQDGLRPPEEPGKAPATP